MQRYQQQLRIIPLRQALTLLELLVVCAILGILVGLTLITVNMVSHSAKVSKTRATIQKLDTAMMQIFESYESRFAAVKRRVADEYPELTEAERQRIAAHIIRDIMRMEMPQCWEEVLNTSTLVPHGPIGIVGEPPSYLAWAENLAEYQRASALLRFYFNAYFETGVRPPEQATLLFLIIKNLNPEALSAFHGSEVGDPDNNGLLMFVDAWGKPIRFLRWAPGFTDSSDLMHREIPDPTDERAGAEGWLLYPLIYSAGPDGIYGIQEGSAIIGTTGINEGILDPFALLRGQPEPPGSQRHLDNIHNHQRHRSF